MLPNVHAIIPVYNDQNYIAQFVDLLKDQTYGNKIKFIFHDDGSTDQTVEALRDYSNGDNRFIINRSAHNQGNSYARIHAINSSQQIDPQAAFLFIDADDFVHPEHIERAMIQMSEKKADVCLLNLEPVAETPELEKKADQMRHKLMHSNKIVDDIRNRPDQLANISNYSQLLEFNHYSVTKAYSARVKNNWLHSSVARTKPDIAMMAVLGDINFNVTALDSGYKSYTYNIRQGSVSDYTSMSKGKLERSSHDLIDQLFAFTGNMPWDVPYPEVGKAAENFVSRHIQEQADLFNQLPLWTRLFEVNDVYQKFKKNAGTVKNVAQWLSSMSARHSIS
jgi:glycosyltransferase involved in cell wall biosynthesis